jgi:hypothetical protein
MGRQKPTAKPGFVLFDVLYADGTMTSNRKVPGSLLGGLEGDAPARAVIEAQDREIAERSGRLPRRSNRSAGPPRAERRIWLGRPGGSLRASQHEDTERIAA